MLFLDLTLTCWVPLADHSDSDLDEIKTLIILVEKYLGPRLGFYSQLPIRDGLCAELGL